MSKLSIRDLAHAACTCQEFQESYLRRVAEERATLIAIGRETYGHGMFRGLVRAFQRSLPGLDTACQDAFDQAGYVMINAAGDPEAFIRQEGDRRRCAKGPRSKLFKGSYVMNLPNGPCILHALVDVNLPGRDRVNFVAVSLYRYPGACHRLTAWMPREAPAAAVGLLLAICTETPETLPLCSQDPVTMEVKIDGLPSTLEGMREAQDLVQPLGLLAESFIIHPTSDTTADPLQEMVQAHSGGVLKSVRVDL